MHFYVRWRKRANYWRDRERERECVRGRGSEERGIASVQRSRIKKGYHAFLCAMEEES
jgi:hypothetical protein